MKEEIGNLPNIKYIYLNNNNLQKLPTSISKLKSLKELRLSNNPISEEEQEKIRKMLPNCKVTFD